MNTTAATTSTPWIMLKKCGRNGFRYFANTDNHDGGVAIADNTGAYPHQTEDGVMWLAVSESEPARVALEDGRVRCILPVRCPGSLHTYRVRPDTMEDLRWLIGAGFINVMHVHVDESIKSDVHFLSALASLQSRCLL